MSSAGNDDAGVGPSGTNDDARAGSSQQELAAHYHEMFLDSQQEQAGSDDEDEEYEGGDEDEDMEDAEDDIMGTGGDTTASGGGTGSETSSQAKRKRERRPNKVGTTRECFTVVDADGVPKEPAHLAKGYFLQLAAILRDTVSLNEASIRKKEKKHLRVQLLARLHARYQFPSEFDNEDLTGNIVNTFALTRFTKALSGFKTLVRSMLKEGADFAKINYHFPKVTRPIFDVFMENEELDYTKKQTLWGKEMRDLNIGNHRLGSRGYDGKQPI